MCAVNTFFEEGAGPTWTGTKGHRNRIDYLLASMQLLPKFSHCFVNRDIELTTSERDDHDLVQSVLEISGQCQNVGSKKDMLRCRHKPQIRLSNEKFKDDLLIQAFEQWIWHFNGSLYENIDLHVRAFTNHVSRGLKIFEETETKPKQPWISKESWVMMKQRKALKKLMRSALAIMKNATLRMYWLAWSSVFPHTFLAHRNYSSLQLSYDFHKNSYRAWACASKAFQAVGRNTTKSLKEDRAKFLDDLAAKADKADEEGDNKQLYVLARRAAGLKVKETNVVSKLDGTLTYSKQGFDERFFEHFGAVFDAKKVQDLESFNVSQPKHPRSEHSQPPSIERAERALHELPNCKALGPDANPAEAYKAGKWACAIKFKEILVKIWTFAYWPFDWRGGRMKELHKKGPVKECDNYRGLLISDHLGKAASSILYDNFDTPYHSYVPETQCGATKKRGTDFATHLLRTLIDRAELTGSSIAILYVDLTKAFDKVLREIVLGWGDGGKQETYQTLLELGYAEKHAQDLVDDIERASVLEECEVPKLDVDLLRSLHTGSWFKVGEAEGYLHVKCGGRQGCRFGGVLFNLAYARALKRFVADAANEGIVLRLRFWHGRAPGHTHGPEDSEEVVFDVTFVDDEAIVLTAAVPKTLKRKFERVVNLLVKTFAFFGFTINWKPGKTEASIKFRGKGAKALQEQLAIDEEKCGGWERGRRRGRGWFQTRTLGRGRGITIMYQKLHCRSIPTRVACNFPGLVLFLGNDYLHACNHNYSHTDRQKNKQTNKQNKQTSRQTDRQNKLLLSVCLYVRPCVCLLRVPLQLLLLAHVQLVLLVPYESLPSAFLDRAPLVPVEIKRQRQPDRQTDKQTDVVT